MIVLCASLLASTASPAVAQSTLRIVAYNIKHGRGMDDQVDLDRIAEVLRGLDADVITLQEVDDRTERTGGVDQVAVLAELLGYEGFHGPHREYQGGFYGNAVLTRLPVVAARTRPIPPASGSDLAVLEIEVSVRTVGGAFPVSVVSVHLAGSPDERMAQAMSVTRDFAAAGRPVVLAGDFNGRPDDDVVLWLADEWAILDKDDSPLTFPSTTPDREIDFIMIRGGGGMAPIEHVVIDEPMASDHRPILAVFALPGGYP